MKNTTIIAIGNRGTALAVNLTAEQVACVTLNEKNSVMAKIRRSKEQLKARETGAYQGALWADSCSFVESRENETFWLGTIEFALKAKLVRKVAIVATQGKASEKLTGYVRADFTGEQSIAKAHKFVAVESKLGRIEACEVGKEKGKGKGARNKLFVRDEITLK